MSESHYTRAGRTKANPVNGSREMLGKQGKNDVPLTVMNRPKTISSRGQSPSAKRQATEGLGSCRSTLSRRNGIAHQISASDTKKPMARR
jgi:hypothetical protein